MSVPDVSVLSLGDHAPIVPVNGHDAAAGPVKTEQDFTQKELRKLKDRAESLPYSIEPHSEMMELLDLIIVRITQCVEAKDFDVGLTQWDSMLS
jgi:proteasome activator subunit 4